MSGSSFMIAFEDDPFFSMHKDHMRSMDEMCATSFSSDPFLAVTDGHNRSQRHGDGGGIRRGVPADGGGSRDLVERSRQRSSGGMMMMMDNPFDMINSTMSNVQKVMGNFTQNFDQLESSPDGHMFSRTAVMSYSNTGNGQPKIYQAMKSTTKAPGGLNETRKALRDSEMALEKMSIGRQINDRGHVITRQRNTRTGDVNENKDYINMAEDETPQFEDEWQQRTRRYDKNNRLDTEDRRGNHRDIRYHSDYNTKSDGKNGYRAIENAPSHQTRKSSQRETHHERKSRHT